jgi:glucose/arabinose dehydrogenase
LKISHFHLFLFFTLLLSSISYFPTIAQQGGYQKFGQIHFYGCVDYTTLFHCDPLHNNLTGFRYPASSIRVDELQKEPHFVPGKYGQALDMQAINREAVHFPKISNITFNDFSVSFWVKGTADAEPLGQILSYTNNHNTAGWYFDMSKGNNTGPTVRFVLTENEGKLLASPDVHIGNDTFHHIVGTFNGSMIKMYNDGKLVGQTHYVGNYTGDARLPLTIGSSSYCASCNRWTGIIDDLRIYGKTLDDREISQIGANAGDSNIPALIGRWNFDGELLDSSNNKNSGTQSTLLASMAFTPDGRLFFTEKNTGHIRIMKDSKVLPEPFASVDDYLISWEQGLLGLTIDPKFNENHFVYVYYTSVDKSTGDVFNRVVRFTDSNNKGISKTVIIDRIFAERGYHAGGALAFGPDDKLYVTVGDATEHPFAQDTAVPIGKVLRVNRDGTIPPDNPFRNSPVYTYGHRNMFGIAFDKSGNGLVSENGDYYYDEINLLKKGGNYGFPAQQPANVAPELSNFTSSIMPLRTYWDTIAPTQMIYYDGDRYPLLKDKFVLGTYQGDVYALKLDKVTKEIVEEDKIDFENYPFKPVIGIAKSPNGDIYFGAYSIWKLNSTDLGAKKQYLYPVKINTTRISSVEQVQFEPSNNKLIVNLRFQDNITNSKAGTSLLTLDIPQTFLPKISAVVNTADNKQLQFTNATRSGYNIISVNIPNSPQLQISVLGASIEAPGEQILVG